MMEFFAEPSNLRYVIQPIIGSYLGIRDGGINNLSYRFIFLLDEFLLIIF
ncbi:Uncharacterised protein [uncultured archaeon]|nr:Uncharacterised protein [uncultured archaeon]